ncbi:hypothetical protein LI99_04370 [Mycolicibacterium smegmatis]|uniref:Uncharacterized protein n=1 Tax=Mycolicibacterium smegmatis (strain ATCC 700084 / mc(2)155) TaxID=246196 RepID=A0QQU4_MYCS2|nr:hypothetical protein MSMEG_0879 [Mycolicibacterium smegmatis MC2 155]AIU12763.1 hypothetical protein LI99_04370 [Mycolicibacterium smegmatis]AIU06138.1 hypothetical protein LJ00_04370 [Mycolicibacterium smegmatis MC2 155]AIU19387.1 hypothetical protein LI98_04370 [Mycolicibacterium smegmatis]TBH46395.1 hypothetical protein EYS45_10550 [Mycolicibacterium smegmatis MC2 155]
MFLRIGDRTFGGQVQCPRRTAGGVLPQVRPRPHRPDLALTNRECQLHS